MKRLVVLGLLLYGSLSFVSGQAAEATNPGSAAGVAGETVGQEVAEATNPGSAAGVAGETVGQEAAGEVAGTEAAAGSAVGGAGETVSREAAGEVAGTEAAAGSAVGGAAADTNQAPSGNPVEASPDATPQTTVDFYYFYLDTCPHCAEAKPLIDSLDDTRPWLRMHQLETSKDFGATALYQRFAQSLGQQARGVPAFFFGDALLIGYDNAEGMGATLTRVLDEVYAEAVQAGFGRVVPGPWGTGQEVAASAPPVNDEGTTDPGVTAGAVLSTTPIDSQGQSQQDSPRAAGNETTLDLPGLGTTDVALWSLPLLTIVLAGLDAFNPCAFFVLLFLLSLLVRTQDRRRIFFIGGLFVLVSGAIYFAFMAAWLNVFLLLGEVPFITQAAGILALVLALINTKDFFWFKKGVSLGIPDAARPGLVRRMNFLSQDSSLPVLVLGTLGLAVLVNLYELLCTLGFPMVYTRILTANGLSAGAYYGYLALYSAVYVIPLLIIVLVFGLTLGGRKLGEKEARGLKLLSGTMMLGLGILLLVSPGSLSNPLVALGVLVGAGLVTGIVSKVFSKK